MLGLVLSTLPTIAEARAATATRARPALARDAAAMRALTQRLPRTAVTKVDCGQIPGICEVQAGTNLFYIDPSARYLIVGRIYDMETHQDLTAARLLAINPDMLVGAAASAKAQETDSAGLAPSRPQSTAAPASAPAQKVSLASLPANGAIEWGSGNANAPKVTVFSDFHCGYCRALHQTLKAIGVRVTERPISILGTRAISEAVICAEDKAAAMEWAYGDQEVAKRACDTSGLDANEAFARAHGFTGTPVLVREDGAVLLGFRPREFLESWLKGGA
ncbi:DsbC family protein [Novosphingobium umbonatum]|uniref:Thiol:disulfide interchange protein n=1 Tax=Novosphingobium umbonatum TaxID=1908524 RepID=A0A3S2UTS3_9SPHN|nr:DsbC family protein [Novosphingobium umbonatum]RVU04762.1 DsbC family protein [Novosphingobium umbonatum]